MGQCKKTQKMTIHKMYGNDLRHNCIIVKDGGAEAIPLTAKARTRTDCSGGPYEVEVIDRTAQR